MPLTLKSLLQILFFFLRSQYIFPHSFAFAFVFALFLIQWSIISFSLSLCLSPKMTKTIYSYKKCPLFVSARRNRLALFSARLFPIISPLQSHHIMVNATTSIFLKRKIIESTEKNLFILFFLVVNNQHSSPC